MKRDLDTEQWKIAIKLLGWMTCAERTLKWHELQGALSIFHEKGIVDFEEGRAVQHIDDLCGALVTVSGGRVMLVHATAKWYVSPFCL